MKESRSDCQCDVMELLPSGKRGPMGPHSPRSEIQTASIRYEKLLAVEDIHLDSGTVYSCAQNPCEVKKIINANFM